MNVKVVQAVGSIIISTLVAGCFLVALVYAYVTKDQRSIDILIQTVTVLFTGVVGFWIGSNMGSQKKDDLLAASNPVVVVPPEPPKFPPPPKAVV